MSAAALTTSPVEELVAGFRGKHLTRNQMLAALTAAGATVAGAAFLVQAIESSPTTPPASPAVASGGHQTLGGIAATNQVALHARHIALQGGGR